jgi:methylenetetrahydrofolate dehydrogenase (NADP+)/methenyltetrahydrofolate cyclohydrolase
VNEKNSTAERLDGSVVAKEIREALRPRIDAFMTSANRVPRLGLLLAGDDAGSEVYVRNKILQSEQLGMETDLRRLPDSAQFSEAMAVVQEFNANPSVDGILVQSPLPSSMGSDAERRIFDAIDAEKDVDGFNPRNVGKLVQNRPTLVPCTPAGIVMLLERHGVDISGKHAVVIGRSDIVGKPMAMLLLHRHATVTICHSRTSDLKSTASSADILVAAVGRPCFVTAEFVKNGAVVIDVGINPMTVRGDVVDIFGESSKKVQAFEKRGQVLAGDVHPEVESVAGGLTPVPGGVGPLTIAMLLSNTVTAAEARLKKS